MRKEGPQSARFPSDRQPKGGGVSEQRPEQETAASHPGLDRATELELIDTALQGDIEAFAVLFEHYRPALYAICLRRLNGTSSAEDAEDAVQDVFIRAFASLPNFDPGRPLWPWLVTIAFRACIDLQRRRSPTLYSADVEVTVDAAGSRVVSEGETGSALDAVIASERRSELSEWLKLLPKRQRRVFLLYTLDGWSCAEIADAEGISAHAVHHLLSRARSKMRSLSENRPLPAIVFPFSWLRWKLQRTEERIRPLLGFHGEGLANACVQAVCLGTLAVVVAVGQPAASLESDDLIRSAETVASMQSLPLQTALLPTALSNTGGPIKAPVTSQQSAEPPGSLTDDVVNPHENATPETSWIRSITVSPNYESDHTLWASAQFSLLNVLFVSHDGGASWKSLPSHSLRGSTVVPSPGYPQDRRLFSIADNDSVLQQSDDGGATFRTVSVSVAGSTLAISPSFGREGSKLNGDSKILMGGKTVLEYDAETGVTQPAFLSVLPPSRGIYSFVAYSPGYPSDPTVFVADNHPDQFLYHCKGSVCDERRFPYPGPLTFLLSPRFDQNDLAYAFTPHKLLVSKDGIRTFREIPFSLPDRWAITDVAILWNKSSDPAIFAYIANQSLPGVYRSLDAGRSWDRTSRIDIPGVDLGVEKLIVTPTGRLLAAGRLNGIACSDDLGQTWAPHCPPE